MSLWNGKEELLMRLRSADSNLAALCREVEMAGDADDLASVLGDLSIVAENLTEIVTEWGAE